MFLRELLQELSSEFRDFLFESHIKVAVTHV